MSDLEFQIQSDPDDNGEHSLRCPKCSTSFLTSITKEESTGELNDNICPACNYTAEPLLFVAEAHRSEVNTKAAEYVGAELKKMFKNKRIR